MSRKSPFFRMDTGTDEPCSCLSFTSIILNIYLRCNIILKAAQMVIGNGLVAKKFEQYTNDDRFVIFASGVSNSKSLHEADYDRERALLKQTLELYPQKKIVYFSTCSVFDPAQNSSRYVLHKLDMEKLIMLSGIDHCIFRVSNLVGKTENKNTVLNFFIDCMQHNKHFNLWVKAVRNLIDVDDVFAIINEILLQDLYRERIINIANPVNYTVKDIVTTLEKVYHKPANYSSVLSGSDFTIDISLIMPLIDQLKINFDENYLEHLLHKYYTN